MQDFFVGLALVSALIFQLDHFADDPGVGWHLKTGEWISQHLAVPHVDPFLRSEVPRQWIADQWLSDLSLWLLYSVGTWPVLYAVIFSCFAAAFFLVLYPVVRSHSGSAIAAAFSILFAFKVAQVHLILRPVVFGILCFAICFRLIAERLAKSNPPSLLEYGLNFVLFVIWVNLHPSWVLGLFLIFIALLCDLPRLQIFPFFLIACLATLLNPYGFELHQSILNLGSSSYFMNLHEEWRPVDFSKYEGLLVEGFIIAIILSLYLRGKAALCWRNFDLVTLIVFLHLALGTVRMLPFFGIVVALPLAKAIGPLWRDGVSRFSRLLRKLDYRESHALGGREMSIISIAFIFGSSFLLGSIPFFKGQYGPSRDKFPYAALEQLSTLNQPSVVISNPNWGGFITLAGSKNIQPIIDDRNTLLGEAFYKEFYANLTPNADYHAYLRRHAATHALLPPSSPIGREFELAGSKILYRDEVSVLHKLEPELLAPLESKNHEKH